MKLEVENIKLTDCITVGDFVKELREKTGSESISPSAIHYHLANTDNLDYVEFGGLKLIVRNAKSESFTPGNFYGKNRTMRKLKL